ncbi:hypothetical protein F5B19DRAFT_189931 [Rostrohypoxylon terebratum]|nr:hypothetical protein F5B19DRAFT_189931 [Rostrohypoxylon terebratum]
MDRSKDPSKEAVVFRCIRSDGMKYDEARFPADHKPADEATVRSYCDRLGAMIAEQVYPGSLQSFTLEGLPEFYQLRVRARTDSKTRNDTFLYGFPEHEDEKEKKKTKAKKQAALKSFRSPAEFFDHLLWLITDATNDEKNCACRFCKPPSVSQEETQEATTSSQPKSGPVPPHVISKSRSASPAARTSAKKTGGAVLTPKAVPSPSIPQAQLSVQHAAQPVAQQLPVQPAMKTPMQPAAQPTVQPAAQPTVQPVAQPVAQPTAQPIAQPTAQPQPPAQPAVQSQTQIKSDESVLFREGEVVWFRKQSSTFRLGIVVQSTHGDPTSTPISRIKPLAHYQADLGIEERSDADLRPFLTYSVPKVQPQLEEYAHQPMEQLQWQALETLLPYADTQRGEYLCLEASKIAASRVDHSYSLFNPLQNPNLSPNHLSFGGVFFGCEKINVFEAVRVHVEADEHPQWDNADLTFVMVLKGIVLEKTEQGERLLFGGDIWVLQDSKDEQAPNQDQMPPAMRREKAFRDEVVKKYGYHCDWLLLRNNTVKTEKFIKGRFYESQKLGPMLYQGQAGQTWDDYIREGIIPTIQKSLNRRLDSWGATIGRLPTRRDAFAGAIPPNFPLSLGPRVFEQPRGT